MRAIGDSGTPMSNLLNILSVAGGIYGAKRLTDAARYSEQAHQINERATNLVADSDALLRAATSSAQGDLAQFDSLRQELWEQRIVHLSKMLERVEFAGGVPLGALGATPPAEAAQLQGLVPYEGRVLGHGGTAVLAGGATALAMYSFVGAVGTASTGAANSGLAGVARESAILASLGGGTKKDGGGGKDGGVVTLSLAAVGTGLFVGGEMAAASASGNLAIAKANFARAEEHIEKTKLALTALGGIKAMLNRLTTALREIENQLITMTEEVEEIIRSIGTHYADYSTEQLKVIHRTIGAALLLRELLQLQVISPKGASLSEECARLADIVVRQLTELGSVS